MGIAARLEGRPLPCDNETSEQQTQTIGERGNDERQIFRKRTRINTIKQLDRGKEPRRHSTF